MTIKVKSYLTMQQVMNNQTCIDVESDQITIQGLLMNLASKFGHDFKSMVFDGNTWNLGPHIRILVNGRHYGTLPEKIDTILKKGDEICLFPPIAGG